MNPPDSAAVIAFEAVARAAESADAPWSVPDMCLMRAELTPPPPLPNFLPPRWSAWLATTAECAGAAPDYVLGALLAGAASLIGNARWGSPWRGWAEPPALNVALVGPPSSGKSPAMDTPIADLTWIETGLNLDWRERCRKHAAEVAEAREHRSLWEREMKTAAKDGLPPPEMPAKAQEPDAIGRRRVFSTEPTTEKAARLSALNPHGLLLVRDELAGWVGSMDRYSSAAGGDRAFWTQSHGGRPWTPDRVKDGDAEISVPHLLWSVLGGIQPDRLASLLLKGDDDGLAARFLYFWPAGRKPTRPNVAPSPEWARDALHRLRRLPWQAPEPIVLPFSRAAANCLQAWREEVAAKEEGTFGLFLSWLGKLPGMALRLAVTLEHLAWTEREEADPPAEIGEAAISAAADLLEGYAVPMARRAFGAAALPEPERDARRIARWLVHRQPMPEAINARELRRMADGPGIADAARTEAALVELAGAGWVRRPPLSRAGLGGRSRADWSINPALREARYGLA